MIDFNFLDNLNKPQRDAVEYIDGPSLVIAGAGSGKTMVLTYKIAYLLKMGMKPYNILSLTFTNKAAREMKERIGKMMDAEQAKNLWMGTFHSIFNHILRIESKVLGFTSDYTIYEPSDCRSLVTSIIKEMGLEEKTYKAQTVCNYISKAKNALVMPKEYSMSDEMRRHDAACNMPMVYEIYSRYFARCHQANVMDFDDLLLYTYILFEVNPEICDKYAKHFYYILVDEYQDTNFAQHKILNLLAKVHKRICVVGDDAQSIYSFRGAKIDNILQFTNQYANARMFKLEQNYRSTQNIVNAANSLIENNKHQIHKTIFSKNEKGKPILLSKVYSDLEEGEVVSNQIVLLCKKDQIPYSSIAILYRKNSQGRVFEESLRKHGIPYRIYGGRSFYDQKEIKDVLAYFRLIVNPKDEEALRRVVKNSVEGIGAITIGKLQNAAFEKGVSIWDVVKSPKTFGVVLSIRTLQKLENFSQLIESMMNFDSDAYTLGVYVIKNSGLLAEAYANNSLENKEIQDNLSELLNGINTFVELQKEMGEEEHVSLADYLSEVALLSDTDDSKTEGKDMVTLMTIHASKGLEFDAVFVVGMEENIFPSPMAGYSEKEMEEERRLFYVAITRSKKRCFLSCAKSRYEYSKVDFNSPSRFLKELDSRCVEENEPKTHNIQNHQKTNYFDSGDIERYPRESLAFSVNPFYKRVKTTETSLVEGALLKYIIINGEKCTVGCKVEHSRFGVGEITELKGTQENCTATVVFRNVGEKHLLLKYAKLTPLL